MAAAAEEPAPPKRVDQERQKQLLPSGLVRRSRAPRYRITSCSRQIRFHACRRPEHPYGRQFPVSLPNKLPSSILLIVRRSVHPFINSLTPKALESICIVKLQPPCHLSALETL